MPNASQYPSAVPWVSPRMINDMFRGENPIHPGSVQKYLETKFGDALEDVSDAMRKLAKSLPPSQLAQKAYALYEKFRPEIPPGKKGWGASGKLDLELIRKMASA